MRNAKASPSDRRPRVRLEDIRADVEVRRHPGARRLTLRVSRTRRAVVVTLPLQCDLEEAGSFLNRHIDWVRQRLDKLPDLVPFIDGATMPLRGEPHRIVFTGETATRIVKIVRTIGQWPELHVPGCEIAAPKRLTAWLKEQAEKDIRARVAFHNAKISVKAKAVSVRDQTSRWGSCSTTRQLSFSWRLILAPSEVLDYVAAHEVAHLIEMNHGPRFWALVKSLDPKFEKSKRWLQVYGPDLHRYGCREKA